MGCLHVVATPIGNLDDITFRAAKVLGEAETIAAEDTRHGRTLLRHLGLSGGKMLSLHEHNEAQVAERLLARLQAGEDVALISDAGAPLVADPGFQLVRRCWQAGIPVRPVPGASAPTTLLSVCPIPADRLRFAGFLPPKGNARTHALAELCAVPAATLFLEAPHRIRSALEAIADQAAPRRVFIGREMTKKFESYYCGLPAELLARLETENALRGEFTCLLESRRPAASEPTATRAAVLNALAGELPPSRTASLMAKLFGGAKADYYAKADKAPFR